LADFAIAEVFVVMKKQRSFKIVRQTVDRGGESGQGFVVFKRAIWRRGFVRDMIYGRSGIRCVWLLGRIETYRRMTSPPAMVIVAEIGKNGEEPGRKARVGSETFILLVKTDKDFGHQIVCVGGIMQIPPRESEERFLPPSHQTVQSGVVTVLEGMKVSVIVVGIRGH